MRSRENARYPGMSRGKGVHSAKLSRRSLYFFFVSFFQRIAKGAGGKGPRQKTSKNVKKCQKVFRHFSTIFAQGKKRQKSSKSVKKFFDTFRQFSRGTFFPAPFAIRWFFGSLRRWPILEDHAAARCLRVPNPGSQQRWSRPATLRVETWSMQSVWTPTTGVWLLAPCGWKALWDSFP